MLANVKYYRYHENEEVDMMVMHYFHAVVYDAHKIFPMLLQKDKQLGGLGVSDFEVCYFPGYYGADEPEYFGETGFMIRVDAPAAVEDSAIYLTNEEYFAEVSKWAPKYLKMEPEDAEEVGVLLEKLRVQFELEKVNGIAATVRNRSRIPNACHDVLMTKTVYDPEVYSDKEMLRMGMEAMREGLRENRISGRRIVGYSSNGIKFVGWWEPETKKIYLFYPVIGA